MSDSIQPGGSSKRFDSGWEKICPIDKGMLQQFYRDLQEIEAPLAGVQ